MRRNWFLLILAAVVSSAAWPALEVRGDEPILKFVSVPDFINMDLQFDDPRLFDLTSARKTQLVNEINSSGPQASINPNVGNFIGTVENGYRGASQVLLEALAAENADFFTVSGDLLYTRWPKGSQLSEPWAAQHIRDQADIYYDDWIDSVSAYAGFGLGDVYTIVGDHEIGDNDWGSTKRPLIPTYKEVYVEKVGNEATIAAGAYVNAPAGFEGRTFAVKRDNLLLVGVDQFETFNSAGQFTQVGSQIASVKIDVTGSQLAWLDNTLAQADSDPSIDHVIVMAHAPIAGRDAVKVGHSSGLKNATGEDGPLWQTLAAHNVDMYMPGEVHDISMQLADEVIQVVTGTNIFQPSDQAGVTNIGFNLNAPLTSEQNYMLVEVYDNRIDLTIKQIETKIWGNRGASFDPLNDDPYKNREARVALATAAAGFQTVGTLTIDKSSSHPVYANRTGLFISEWTFGAPINIDLNGDTFVNLVDALQFKQYFHTSLTGLTAQQAFSRGDLNGDFFSDHADFRLFKVAYNEQVGPGAFETAWLVPEPASLSLAAIAAISLLRCRRRRALGRLGTVMTSTVPLAILGLAFLSPTAQAANVTGWVAVHPTTGAASTKPLSGAATNSPILGNGSEDSAAMVALYADINGTTGSAADVSLTNGQKVTLSGSATFTGIISAMEQFRWGLFNESASPFDAFAWRGYFASNSAGSGGGALRAKDAEAGTTFAQTGNAVNLKSEIDGDDFIDETYHFAMSVSRFNDEVSIDASLTSAEDWTQSWKDVVTSVPNQVTFDFNRVGLLAGNGIHANQINFSNIDVTVAPINALTLEVTTTGQNAGAMRICNDRPAAFGIEYYEIKSDAGSLDSSGWSSLDEQEGSDPDLQGWEESADNDGNLLSEYRLFSSTTVPVSSGINLGHAFQPGSDEDLEFWFGLADGSFVRGVVEYVPGTMIGDYNQNSQVDAADYVVWRNTLNANVQKGTGADGDANGVIGQADHTVWRSRFGNSSGSGGGLGGSQTVPEAGTLSLALIAIALGGWRRPQRHGRR